MFKLLIVLFTSFVWAQEAPAPQAPMPEGTAAAQQIPMAAPEGAPGQPGQDMSLEQLQQMVTDPGFTTPAAPAFDTTLFDNLKIHKDQLPLEFELFFNMLRKYSETPQDKEYVVEVSYKLASYFRFMPKESRILLLKSEIVRNILEYRFEKFSSNLDVNNFVIDKALQKIKKFTKQYDEAALFVINSCIGDLAKYYDEEILNNMKLIKGKNLSFKEAQKIQDIKAKMKYLRPWFYFFDKLSPGEFNEIVLDLTFEMFKNIENKTFLTYHFAPDKENTDKIFELPEALNYQISLFKVVPMPEQVPQGDPALDANTMQMLDNMQVPPAGAAPEGAIQQIEQGLEPQYTPAGQ